MKNSYSNIFSFNKKILKKSIDNLSNGNVVGLPTETVYGLGGNAYSKISTKKIYKLKKFSVNQELAKKTGCSLTGLRKIVKKGQGAYYSYGSRPNQSAHSWGYARLGSSITGGKAAAVDFNILNDGCSKNSKALRLAKNARKKFGYGTRKVPKTKL